MVMYKDSVKQIHWPSKIRSHLPEQNCCLSIIFAESGSSIHIIEPERQSDSASTDTAEQHQEISRREYETERSKNDGPERSEVGRRESPHRQDGWSRGAAAVPETVCATASAYTCRR